MQASNQVRSSRSLPTLRRGSTGNDVKYLQELLNYNSYSVANDGIFGAKTEAAVRNFQKSRSLVVDGIVGTKTWNALLAAQGC